MHYLLNIIILVSLTPSQDVVTTPGRSVPFVCESINSRGLRQLHWLVNGTRLEDLSLGDRVEDYMSRGVRTLFFLTVSVEYNDTTIQCIANFSSGEIVYSNNVSLLVQGEEKLM